MAGPFHFADRLDRWYLLLGFLVALMESIADPAATILIGKMWQSIELLVKGTLSPGAFLGRGQNYAYGLVGVTVYSALMNSVGYFVWNSLAFRIGHTLRSSLFRVLVQRQASSIDAKGSLQGETTMHFKDIQDIEVACGIVSYEMLAMASGCLVEIGVAFYFSWAVTLVCLAGVPLLVLIGSIFSPPTVRAILSSKSTLEVLSVRVSWVLNSLTTVKLLQKEQFEELKAEKGLRVLEKKNLHYWFLSSSQQGLCRTVVLMIFMQGFYFGSFMVKDHGLSAGNVVTVFWCCLNASALLQAFMSHLAEWNKANASAQRLRRALRVDEEQVLCNSIGLMPDPSSQVMSKFESLGWHVHNEKVANPFYSEEDSVDSPSVAPSYLLSSPSSAQLQQQRYSSERLSSYPPSPLALSPSSGEIELTDVVFSYPARHEIVLSGLSLKIDAGKTTFVIGRSGSGKSTLASLLSKQYSWQAGEITINGYDIHLLSKSYIESNVYVCEQSTNLFDISIRENVALGSRNPSTVTDAEIRAALVDACAEFVFDLPDQADTLGVDKLSGGQQQRLALARARLRDAPVMVYDEITSALDKELRAEVISRLLTYRHCKTTLIITHDLDIIPHGHIVYAIENGQAHRFSDIKELIGINESTSGPNESEPEIKARLSSPSAGIPQIKSLQASGIFVMSDNGAPEHRSLSVRKTEDRLRSKVSESAIILRLLRSAPNKCLLIFGLLVSAVHAAINPVFSFVFSKLIVAIVDPDTKGTTKWAMLVLMLAVLDGLVTWAKYVLHISAERWLRVVRGRLYTLLLESRNFKLGNREASYYAKLLLSDSEKCAEVMSKYVPGLLSILVIGLAGFVCSFAFGWKLTLVGLSLLPAFIGINQAYKKLVTHWTRVRELKRVRVIRLIMELTSERGHHTLEVQHLEGFFKTIYQSTENELYNLTVPLSLQIGGGYGILKCFPYALEALVLWYGIHLIGVAEYTVQQTMTVFSLLMFTIVTIDQLTSTIGNIGNGFEALERLQDALAGKDEATKPGLDIGRSAPTLESRLMSKTEPQWEEVSFQRVGKVYRDGTSILGNFTETFRKGEVVAITGPSGVGKSGIARLLERLEDPSSGEIVIDREWDLERLSLYSVRQNVGLVSQTPQAFYDGTIEEAVLYGSGDYTNGTASVVEVCKLCGAHEFISRLENGYDTRVKSGQLSGGQLQRLGIAQVLIRQPKVLVLDECTSALDEKSKNAVKKMIKTLRDQQNMIIILVTHQDDVAEIADRVVVVK